MLPKELRVDRNNINRIFKEGKFLVSPHLTFKFIKTNDTLPARISFIAPKSISKKAIIRNKLRRIGYKALSQQINDIPHGVIGAFVFKQHEDNISKLEKEIKGIFSKLN